MSDTILYSQNNLEDLIARVSSLQAEMSSVCSRLAMVDTSGEAGGNYRGGVAATLSGLTVYRVAGGTVRESVQSYRRAASAFSSYLSDLSRAMKTVRDGFITTEEGLRSGSFYYLDASGKGPLLSDIRKQRGLEFNSFLKQFPSVLYFWHPDYLVGKAVAMGVSGLSTLLSQMDWSDPKFKLKMKDDLWKAGDGNKAFNLSIDASLGVEGSLWKTEGSVESEWGKAEGSVTVGGAAVSGSVGATLFKDGKFSPDIHAKVQGEIYALKAEGSGRLGTQDYNVYGKAEGKLLGASGEAKASFGKDGFEAKAGAEAYLAKGEIEGGITLFGIKIGAKGEAMVGVAAEVGGKAAADGAEGTVKIGPIGLTLSVDWTGFNWFGLKK